VNDELLNSNKSCERVLPLRGMGVNNIVSESGEGVCRFIIRNLSESAFPDGFDPVPG